MFDIDVGGAARGGIDGAAGSSDRDTARAAVEVDPGWLRWEWGTVRKETIGRRKPV